MYVVKRLHRMRLPALLLAVLVWLAALLAPLQVRADTTRQELQDRYDQAQQNLKDIRAQIDAAEQDIANSEQQRELTRQQQDLILEQIDNLNTQMEIISGQIEQLWDQIIAKQKEIDAKQAEFDERWAGFKERMAGMQMLNDGGSIALLSNASNLYELLTFSQTLQDIADRDQQICQELDDERAALDEQKALLEEDKRRLEENEAALEAQQAELNVKCDELAATIQFLDSSISASEAQKQALEQSESEAERAFQQAANELSSWLASQNDRYSDPTLRCSLNFGVPLSGYTRVSQAYGNKGHTGVDIAAPAWTEIYAVADGRVTASGYHHHPNSYGNYVQILHGSDDQGRTFSTLYAHMIQTPSVKEGQYVVRGQLIGYVGNTGRSFGYHLHLEMKVNNQRISALTYVPLP